ncbi:hypothetical protein ATK30_6833 [Amycolatopsis echigonensis]|uniref:Uncharacterized protein n=1 Tax=Amycolatopsis echigonensis TaxID=2576905 RepID=A0A2N3WPX2_9PSEU|nr:hypothetical protein [Amycolatopsis niigatensis]PKV95900.1 hypothetical protein ATK30_6833 [Amycolatopsis niigatensis]
MTTNQMEDRPVQLAGTTGRPVTTNTLEISMYVDCQFDTLTHERPNAATFLVAPELGLAARLRRVRNRAEMLLLPPSPKFMRSFDRLMATFPVAELAAAARRPRRWCRGRWQRALDAAVVDHLASRLLEESGVLPDWAERDRRLRRAAERLRGRARRQLEFLAALPDGDEDGGR